MKKPLLILFLILLLPISLALTDKVIYNGWILAGSSFISDNQTYNVDYVNKNNATIVSFPEGISAVLYASSENCTKEWIYTVCQTKQKFERGGLQTIPFANSANINVSLFLKINKTDVALDMVKNITPETIFLSDRIEIKTTIENKLQTEFFNVSFVDTFPASSYIEEAIGCIINSSSVYWQGNINKEKKVLCTYILRPLNAGIFKSSATLSYDALGRTNIKMINSTFNILQGPFVFYINTTNASLKTREILLVNITIKALNDFDIKELKISFPQYFTTVNASAKLKQTLNVLSYDGEAMKKGEQKTFFFKTNTGHAGSEKINVSLSYSYNNLVKDTKKEIGVNYSDTVFQIYFYKKENASVIRLSNTNNESYRNIKLVFEDFSSELPLLDKLRYKEFDFPLVEENIKHKINVSYFSEYNQLLSHSFLLKYGESTGDEKRTLAEQKEEVKKETKKTKNKFKLNVDKNTILIVAGVFLLSAILFIFINFLISKNKKSNLDKEIEKIKKEADKYEKD